MKKILLIIAIIPFMFACNQAELDKLKAENEELKSQVGEDSQKIQDMSIGMLEVGALLDSIEISEKNVNRSLEQGTSFDSYKEKMRAINDYMKQSKEKIDALEKQLKSSGSKNKALQAMISTLKKSIEEKEATISTLESAVTKLSGENKDLISLVDVQKTELSQQSMLIDQKRKELSELESRLKKTTEEANKAQADAYFARAETLEELADRTKLAPKKKKETLQEAYDMFKKAFEAGRIDANERMKALEDQLK